MESWAERCGSGWLDAGLAAALVTGFTVLAMIQCRQPARRRVWGRSGLIASLAVIPLVWLSPIPKVDLKHPTSIFWMFGPSSHDAQRGPASNDPSVAPDTEVLGATVAQGLLIVLACGWAVGFCRLCLGLAGSRQLVRRSRRASRRAEALLESLPFAGQGHQRPRLLISDRLDRPVLVGFFRPVILSPSQLDRPEAEAQLRLGLLHELAHAEVGDHQVGLIASISQVVWFFLPQVWWLRGQLRLDAEFLADHRAVGHFGTSYGYARSLVGFALDPALIDPSKVSGDRLPAQISLPKPFPRGAGGLASSLFQRVQMLLRCPFDVEDHAPRAWTVSVAIMMVGWTLMASCLSIQGGRGRSEGMARTSLEKAVRAFRLAELAIAPQRLDNPPFNLRFRMPERFELACEVLAEPAELAEIEILGYRLGPSIEPSSPPHLRGKSSWRKVEIFREAEGSEAVYVDGTQIHNTTPPAAPASWLTIRPVPGRTTRLRSLTLTWRPRAG